MFTTTAPNLMYSTYTGPQNFDVDLFKLKFKLPRVDLLEKFFPVIPKFPFTLFNQKVQLIDYMNPAYNIITIGTNDDICFKVTCEVEAKVSNLFGVMSENIKGGNVSFFPSPSFNQKSSGGVVTRNQLVNAAKKRQNDNKPMCKLPPKMEKMETESSYYKSETPPPTMVKNEPTLNIDKKQDGF